MKNKYKFTSKHLQYRTIEEEDAIILVSWRSNLDLIRYYRNSSPITIPQQGEPVIFTRKTSEQSEIPGGLSQRQLYDYIRMLDGEGYSYHLRSLFYSPSSSEYAA